MDASIASAAIEKECGALGGLFQTIINDMRGSSPIWEDFTCKAGKLHSSLRTSLLAISAFLDAFQKVADLATGSRGATKEVGSALTRICIRHRSIESKLKTLTSSVMDGMVMPLQEKLEDWKKVVVQLDKDHSKEESKGAEFADEESNISDSDEESKGAEFADEESNISDSDEESKGAEFADEESIISDSDDETSNCQKHTLDKDASATLYHGCRLTLAMSMMLILTFVNRHNLTSEALKDLLVLIELHCAVPNICRNSYKLYNAFFADLKGPVEFHYFCYFCEFYHGQTNPGICHHCKSQKDSIQYFIYLPITSQLKSLFERNDIFELLEYPIKRQKQNVNNIEDVFDGSWYKNHFENGFFKNTKFEQKKNETHISFQLNTDGVSLFRSSSYSVWPIYLTVNELPPKIRFSSTRMFAGLWFGKQKPKMNVFFTPLKDELITLYTKEYKKAKYEIKKASSDTVRLQKKMRKGKNEMQSKLDHAMHDVNDKYKLLEETEKNALRTALKEERGRFCLFISCIKPFVDNEVALLTEITHLQEIMHSLCQQASDPHNLPESSEQVITDIKGIDAATFNLRGKNHQHSPPSSPSSLGSRKSSMCSISSINSSSSGSLKSQSPSHSVRARNVSQNNIAPDQNSTDNDGSDTPEDKTPTTPNASTPSAISTWNNWPNHPSQSTTKIDSNRPHTISSAYEKSQYRQALSKELFEPLPETIVELRHNSRKGPSHQSSSLTSPYARPNSATINKMQPVLPPLGPKPRPKAVSCPKVPRGPPPIYANTIDLAKLVAERREELEMMETPESERGPTPPTPSNDSMQKNSMELAQAIKELEESTAALESTYEATPTDYDTSHTSLQLFSGYSTTSYSEDIIPAGDIDLSTLTIDVEKYFTIPRSGHIHEAYKAVVANKRPASTTGLPITNSRTNSLKRNDNSTARKPPPPVRRSSSVSNGSGVIAKFRTSPPHQIGPPVTAPKPPSKVLPGKQNNSKLSHDRPYAELQLIKNSIKHQQQQKHGYQQHQLYQQELYQQEQQQQQHSEPPVSPSYLKAIPISPDGSSTGSVSSSVSGNTHYAVSAVHRENISDSQHMQGINNQFAAMSMQHNVLSSDEMDFPLPPTDDELKEIEKIYSRPPPQLPAASDLEFVKELKCMVIAEDGSDV